MKNLSVTWNFPTSVRFGPGRIAELASACRELGMSRPLLVTDPGLAGLAMIADAVARNEADGLPTAVFSQVHGNPLESDVAQGVRAFRTGGHDGVIAFGGGSAMDTGKNIALMAGQSRALFDFIDEGDNWTRVDEAGMAPVVAVPTTAGTGSEVGRSAVVTQEATTRKKVIFHPRMLPAIVISDPELTVGLPASITAWVGMDALSHCLEAFCAPMYHPMADGIALEGMRLVAQWLPRAFADGRDIEARGHMLVAASMGATAFQKGLGSMHAMSHPCSAHHGSHHGLTNAVVMPYVLNFNRPVIEDRMVHLARWLDLKPVSFAGVMDWVLDMRSRLEIPHTLVGLEIEADDIERLAIDAQADPLSGLNPRPVTQEDYGSLFTQALEGRIG